MALGTQVIDLIGLNLLHDASQVAGVGQVAVVELEARIVNVRILVDVVNTVGIERAGAAFDAVHFVTFFQQQFNETIAKGIDYFEGEDKLLFSYYLYDNGWKNYLRVCNLAFDTILLDQIAEGDTIGYQTFTLLNEHLIFVKDKLKLKIYEKL